MLSSLTQSNIPSDTFFTFHLPHACCIYSSFHVTESHYQYRVKTKLMLLACIRKALISHMGRNIGYPERVLRSFTQSCKESAAIVPKLATIASSRPSPIFR